MPKYNPKIATRITPTAGQEITVFQQLIGNFGRFENKNDKISSFNCVVLFGSNDPKLPMRPEAI